MRLSAVLLACLAKVSAGSLVKVSVFCGFLKCLPFYFMIFCRCRCIIIILLFYFDFILWFCLLDGYASLFGEDNKIFGRVGSRKIYCPHSVFCGTVLCCICLLSVTALPSFFEGCVVTVIERAFFARAIFNLIFLN